MFEITLSEMTYNQEAKSLIALYNMGYKYRCYNAINAIMLIMLLGEVLINSKILFLKILIFSEFLTSRLSLFYSIVEEGKK